MIVKFSELLENVMKYAVQNYTKVDSDTEFGITWGEESKRISFCAELVRTWSDIV